MTLAPEHAELVASYRKLVDEVAKKTTLAAAASRKGPKAYAAAYATATKAERRRDVVAAKLLALGVALPK